MSFNDPIADFLTRVRNALKAQHKFVDIPHSKMKVSIAKLLEENGYVGNVIVNEEKRAIRIYLKYARGTRDPIIQGLKRISSPGLRRHVKSSEIPRVRSGLGLAVLTTPQGILTGDKAKKANVGGELLCYVW